MDAPHQTVPLPAAALAFTLARQDASHASMDRRATSSVISIRSPLDFSAGASLTCRFFCVKREPSTALTPPRFQQQQRTPSFSPDAHGHAAALPFRASPSLIADTNLSIGQDQMARRQQGFAENVLARIAQRLPSREVAGL